jgi:hypothetical protein
MTTLERIVCLIGIALWLVVILLVTGCAFAPSDAVQFDPPAVYRTTWESAEACTGVHKRYERIVFWRVPAMFESPAGEAVGWTDYPNIYIAEDYLDHPMVVKHEMIHALGYSGHPPVFETCRATWATWTNGGSLVGR